MLLTLITWIYSYVW